MKSKLIVALIVLATTGGAFMLNGCGSSTSSPAKFTIIGSGN